MRSVRLVKVAELDTALPRLTPVERKVNSQNALPPTLADTQTEPGNASFRKDTHENEIDHATGLKRLCFKERNGISLCCA